MQNETQTPQTNDTNELSARERAGIRMLPPELKMRRERALEGARRIDSLLSLLKEFAEELRNIGEPSRRAIGERPFDASHVAERERMLGAEYAGQLEALEIFDGIEHEHIREEVGKLGREFSTRITACQQMMESFFARFERDLEPFTKDKEPELAKFEKEIKSRLADISYLTKQHAEVIAAAADAKAGDEEQIRDDLIAEYEKKIKPVIEDFEDAVHEFETFSKFAFRKRKKAYEEVQLCAAEIDAVNSEYAEYKFVRLKTYEMPAM